MPLTYKGGRKGFLNFLFMLKGHADGVLVDDIRKKLVGVFIPEVQDQIRGELAPADHDPEDDKEATGIFGGLLKNHIFILNFLTR